MHAAPHRIAVALLAGTTLLLTACGDADTQPAAASPEAVPPTTDLTAPSIETVPTTAASDAATTLSDEECTAELRTLEVATEAYVAQNGVFPPSESELVGDYIREEATAYDLVPDTGEVVRVPGVPCPLPADEQAAAEQPITVDQVLAEMGEDGVALIGGDECAREFAEIAVAGERFIAREGRDPESLDELVDDLAVELVLWTYDDEIGSLVPAEGSPCADVFSPDGPDDACEPERRTLTVAVEAYSAQYGAAPASEDDLVPEFMRVPVDGYDLDADASVVAVPGGPCDTVP